MSRRLAEPYKRHTFDRDYDVIVIGSGIGGLAAAAMLAHRGGKRGLVLERHYTPGGYTHTFHRPGYDWDVGVHYVGGVGPGEPIRRMFDEISDGSLQWADMGEVYDRVIIGGDVYDLPKGRRNLRESLLTWFPDEAEAIDGYFAAVRSAVSAGMPFFASKALPSPVAGVGGPLLRRGFRQWSDRTTAEVLAELTDNRRLKAVLTAQMGDYGLPPGRSSFAMHATVANHYFRGGWYPVGGAASIIPVIEAAGGTVLINAEVERIVVEGGRAVGVRLAEDGRVLRAPVVVSDAGVVNTFGRLLDPEVRDRHGLATDLDRVTPSIGHLSLYLGFAESSEALDLPRHNLWIYPHDDYDRLFDESRIDPQADLPMVYVSFPSAKDPDFERRHPGHATIDVITAAPYEWFDAWAGTRWKRRGADYEAVKADLQERMLRSLFEQLPQLRGRIDVAELSTPLTTEHFAGYPRGELYGIDHDPQRFRQDWLKPASPVPGLYLTGQDITTCGVGGALFGGVLTAAALMRGRLLTGMAAASARKVIPGR